MNPHLKYANARKGHVGSENGRAIGIEVGRVFPRIVDSILLLDSAGFLTAKDKASLMAWFADYQIDFAIFRLDRPVTDRVPSKIRRAAD